MQWEYSNLGQRIYSFIYINEWLPVFGPPCNEDINQCVNRERTNIVHSLERHPFCHLASSSLLSQACFHYLSGSLRGYSQSQVLYPFLFSLPVHCMLQVPLIQDIFRELVATMKEARRDLLAWMKGWFKAFVN